MKRIGAQSVTQAVKALCIQANYHMPKAVTGVIQACKAQESWLPAQSVLEQILHNGEIAHEGVFPACQDTGMACIFAELGQDVYVEGSLREAIHEGVRQGYEAGYLRKSIVDDPLERKNTGDNTPAMITFDVVPGECLKLSIIPKGAGSENMSRVAMLSPSAGRQGVVDFVVETVRLAGSNPCPPIVLGVGVGGSFDQVTALAKKALLRPLGEPSPKAEYADLEREILMRVNQLGIGPAGLGGDTTALAAAVEACPTHIAMLPVAVNINCHVARVASVVLEGEAYAG